MASFNDGDGVWRTISGRRVFIRSGQSISSAMKASGKFKKSKRLTEEEKGARRTSKAINKLEKRDDLSEREQAWKDELKETREKLRSGMTKEERIKELESKAGGNKNEFTREELKAKYGTDNTDVINAGKEKGDRVSLKSEKSTSDIMNEKIRSRGKTKDADDLPKKVEIKEQGTSNRKEVSENIQAHILEHYDSPDDFIQQMDAMGAPTMWKAGEEIAKGGSYLIYNDDMANFLNDLKINPKGKEFSDDRAFKTYTSLVGRESAKLYDRLQKNAYKKYMKEHPLSKMTFGDFKDMKKQ